MVGTHGKTPPHMLVFVPAYNCERQIGRVISQLNRPGIIDRFAEVLVLDNRSSDGTLTAAIDAARACALGRVTVARNRENYGLGGSHKAAFAFAIENGFSHIVTFHGDDQGAIADLIPVLDNPDFGAYDCWLGARFLAKSRLEGYSVLRTAGNHVFNVLFSTVSGRWIHDLGSGLNVYAVSALKERYWMRFHDNLMFNYCMILAHVLRRDRIHFFPISWREDDQVSSVKLFSQASGMLGLLGRYALQPKALLSHEFRSNPREDYKFDIIERDL